MDHSSNSLFFSTFCTTSRQAKFLEQIYERGVGG